MEDTEVAPISEMLKGKGKEMQSGPPLGCGSSLRGEVGRGQPPVKASLCTLRQGSLLQITVGPDLVVFASVKIFCH